MLFWLMSLGLRHQLSIFLTSTTGVKSIFGSLMVGMSSVRRCLLGQSLGLIEAYMKN